MGHSEIDGPRQSTRCRKKGESTKWLRSIALQGLQLDPESLRNLFDREPFGFEHSLSGLDPFKFEELHALAEKYIRHSEDYYVAYGAPRPDTVFFSVPRAPYLPHEAMQHLETGSYRILLKRPEHYDLRRFTLTRRLGSFPKSKAAARIRIRRRNGLRQVIENTLISQHGVQNRRREPRVRHCPNEAIAAAKFYAAEDPRCKSDLLHAKMLEWSWRSHELQRMLD